MSKVKTWKWGNASTAERRRRAKAAAEDRRCPACGRGGALAREEGVARGDLYYPAYYRCRWCGWTGDRDDLRTARATSKNGGAD